MEGLADRAQSALIEALVGAFTDLGQPVGRDAVLPEQLPRQWLNVVKSARPPEILSELMGLGEDEVTVDFVQTFQVEWITSGDDDDERRSRFGDGLEAIDTAIAVDRTLGGLARGCTLAPPDYEAHRLAGSPGVSAVNVPVRVVLRGRSTIA